MATNVAVSLGCTKSEVPAPDATSPEASSAPQAEANALRRFLETSIQESSTIDTFAEVFGPARRSTRESHAYEILAPVDDVDHAILGYRTNQDREILEAATLVFREGARPTLQAVADRLGIRLAEGPLRTRNSCFDGYCPSVTLVYPTRGAGLRLSVYVEEPGGASTDQPRDARGYGVHKIYFSISDVVCPIGKTVAPATPLPAPRREVENMLSAALLEGARELSRDTYDVAALEAALHLVLPRTPKGGDGQEVEFARGPFKRVIGPSFRVTFVENSISKFTWVRYFARDSKVVPFGLPGLTYVTDPSILCRIGGSGAHLWEFPSQGKFRAFVKMSIARDLSSERLYVTSISLERSPVDWPHRIY